MKIATSLCIRSDEISEPALIAALAKAGFDGIDLPFYRHVDEVDWSDDRAAGAWAERRVGWAAKAGVEWVQAHGPFFDMFGEDEAAQRSREMCRHGIKACGRLGVPWMVLHPDIFPGAFDAGHVKAMLDGNAEFFRSLLDDCEKYKVGIAIENIFDDYAKTRGCERYFAGIPQEQCALIDALDHPLMGACWDTGHAHMNHQDQRGGIVALGERLKAIHIQETRSGKDRDDHVLPYSIENPGVDWEGVVAGLREIGFPGPFTFEVHSALQRVPMELLDSALVYKMAVGRYLMGKVATP